MFGINDKERSYVFDGDVVSDRMEFIVRVKVRVIAIQLEGVVVITLEERVI
ncbi:MAG: hypothetical protein GY749_09235 [Desulfobacteraceae bacterium]|nr:hypothetical protein [Desulfobacteraceae bacterium]